MEFYKNFEKIKSFSIFFHIYQDVLFIDRLKVYNYKWYHEKK